MSGEVGPAVKGRRVLVVEDEYLVADEIARALARSGAAVLGPVPSLAAFRRVLRLARPDAAVLDVRLKGEMVWPALDELLALRVPVALVTGYDRAMMPPAYAAVPVFSKPVCFAHLGNFFSGAMLAEA